MAPGPTDVNVAAPRGPGEHVHGGHRAHAQLRHAAHQPPPSLGQAACTESVVIVLCITIMYNSVGSLYNSVLISG